MLTLPDGTRYEGGFMNDKRSGKGVQWLPGGQVFDGAWAEGFPLQGTAMKPGGILFRATFDGKTDLTADSLDSATRRVWTWAGCAKTSRWGASRRAARCRRAESASRRRRGMRGWSW